MSLGPLFRKSLVLMVFVIAGLVFLAYHLTLQLTADVNRDPAALTKTFARLIESQKENPVEFVKTLNSSAETGFPHNFDLIDVRGISLLSQQETLSPDDLADLDWPEGHEVASLQTKSHGDRIQLTPLGGDGATGTAKTFLLIKSHRLRDWAWRRILIFSSIFTAILLGSGLVVLVVFSSFRKKAVLALDVIQQLQGGNLKARFPIDKLDEVGRFMVLFNKMADEIERLVEHLRDNEKTRIGLVQELAHDLRTPVASLKNLIETLKTGGENLEPSVHEELFQLAVKETDYLTQLIDDLLFLAQVMEPKYKPQNQFVSIGDLLSEEVHIMAARYPEIQFTPVAASSARVAGHPHLLKRLVRNALDNAASFARSKVEVQLRTGEKDRLEISVHDDGPGLDAEALSSFGKKKSTRVIGGQREGRLSVGLGSVIMSTIAQNHSGLVQISNHLDSEGKITGAFLRIELPADVGRNVA